MDQSAAPRLTYKVEMPGGQSRLTEATLYVVNKYAEARKFGLTKLNKVLWRADFRAFADRGVPVTGRQYQRLAQGPAPVEMPIILESLLANNAMEIEKRRVFQFSEHRPIARAQPSMRWFSPDDLSYLDEAIQFYWDWTARSLSKHSHGRAWETRSNGDPMAYELARLSDDEMKPMEKRYFARLGKARGWRSN
jgi:hypothetical protein